MIDFPPVVVVVEGCLASSIGTVRRHRLNDTAALSRFPDLLPLESPSLGVDMAFPEICAGGQIGLGSSL